MLYNFSGSDGANPTAALTLGSDGSFYGATSAGGPSNDGTIFSLYVDSIRLSINMNGVVNSASYAVPVAPGSIAAVFGTFLPTTPSGAGSLPLPTSLDGLSIQVGTAPLAPLFYTSQNQVNLQIPWELVGQTQTTISVTQNGQTSGAQTVSLATYAPGIFVVNAQTNQGAILDADYDLVGPANPVAPGEYVQIYCTGLGPVTSQPPTGGPALSDPLSWTTITPAVTIGDAPAFVSFSGLSPGEVGLYQVDAQIPATSTKGQAVPVTISVGGVPSNTVSLAVQ
jgi:uncharacterized protein (TIGR03437 family)